MNSFCRFINTLPGLLVLLICVTSLGSLIIQHIEAPNEERARIHVSKTRQKIFILAQQLALKGDQADWSKLVGQVDKYREKLHEAWQAGTDELTIDLPVKWTLWGSIYYCFTLYTTIGYGDLYPATRLGKLFTLLYGLVSLPLCSLIISRLSTGLVRLGKAIYQLALDSSTVPVGLREAFHRADGSYNFRILPSLGLLIAYLSIGGLAYPYATSARLYKWGKLDSFYFAFVTLSTIGFGDFIPDKEGLLACASLAYIFLGLALVGVVLGRLTIGLDSWFNRIGAVPDDLETVNDAHAVKRPFYKPHDDHLKQQ